MRTAVRSASCRWSLFFQIVVLRLQPSDYLRFRLLRLLNADLLLNLDLRTWDLSGVQMFLDSVLGPSPLRDTDVVGLSCLGLDPVYDGLVDRKLRGSLSVELNRFLCHLRFLQRWPEVASGPLLSPQIPAFRPRGRWARPG